ncbi:MAG: prolipoprotein diacylglyceryl transferase [Sandaracinaceae bacterium]|nr:prolipoprotein diacylglyceryl transferase [Myxococcales bacterium]MCB9658889.1 prolipoprotein diacylglyceryl transferase [Sandaracinaceae bacterium]
MYPTLFTFFDYPVPAYFTLLIIGFSAATFLGARVAKRGGHDPDTIIDLGLFSLIMGVLGARVLHVFADGFFMQYVYQCVDPTQVAWPMPEAECLAIEGWRWNAELNGCAPLERDCFAWAKFWQGGLAYYGGLIAASAFGIWFLKHDKYPVLKGVDIAGMGIPLGLFFGRMGCFLGGCCFGVVSDSPWALVFPPGSSASREQHEHGLLASVNMESLPVVPAQLFEAIGCLAIAAFTMLWLRPRKRFDGQLMLVFLVLYAFLRFGLEYVRADDRGDFGWFTTSQWISLVIVAFCAVAWPRLRAHAVSLMAAPAAAGPEAAPEAPTTDGHAPDTSEPSKPPAADA